MQLIIGGAYQGKLTWARRAFSLDESELFDLELGLPEKPVRCLYHLEAYTKNAATLGKTAGEALKELKALMTADAVLVAREAGSGVVPLDAGERAWRELHGRLLSLLAERAERTVRIFCGLAEELK